MTRKCLDDPCSSISDGKSRNKEEICAYRRSLYRKAHPTPQPAKNSHKNQHVSKKKGKRVKDKKQAGKAQRWVVHLLVHFLAHGPAFKKETRRTFSEGRAGR